MNTTGTGGNAFRKRGSANRPLFALGTGAVVCSLALSAVIAPTAFAATGDTITGIAWQDYSGDGIKEVTDPVLAGIEVMAVDDDGNETAAVTTGADGTYSLTLPSDAASWRVVAAIPDEAEWALWEEGYVGPDNGSSVQFADAGATNVDFSFHVPDAFVEYNPFVYVPIARFGALNGSGATKTAGVVLPWDAGNTPKTLTATAELNAQESTASTWRVKWSEIGSTNGSAWQRDRDDDGVGRLFTAAYLKSNVALGPGGIGAIYEVTPTDGTMSSPTADPAVLLDLADYGIDVGESGRVDEASWTDSDYLYEATDRFPYIGTNGLGGMSLSPDGNTLFVVNLKNRSLVSIDVSDPSAIGAVTEIELDSYFSDSSDLRPFGLTVDPETGSMYMSVSKTGEITGDSADTGLQVYRFDPSDPAALELVLDQKFGTLASAALWSRSPRAWANSSDDVVPATGVYGFQYQQYIASDVSVLHGNLVIGLRSRTGDQAGAETPITLASGTVSVVVGATGATLLAVPQAGGTFEFAVENWNFFDDGWTSTRGESQGSMATVPSRPDGVLVSGIHVGGGSYETGIRRLNTTTGNHVNALGPVLNKQPDGVTQPSLAKANGLGSISALAGNAPIEIGNRVWFDADRDGEQDASEVPIEGVTVRLLNADGDELAVTTTDADGVYKFRSDEAPGLTAHTEYVVEFDASSAVLPTSVVDLGVTDASAFGLTNPATVAELFDSNPAIETGRASVTTGGWGENDHSIDAGYVIRPNVGLDKKVLLAGESPADAPAASDTFYEDGTPKPRVVAVGDTIRYVLTVTAAIGAPADDVTVADKLPTGLIMTGYASTMNGAVDTQQYDGTTWTIGDMAAGDTAQLIVTARVGSLTPLNQQVTNVAQLSVDGEDVLDVEEKNPGRDGGRNAEPDDGYDEVDILIQEDGGPGSAGTTSGTPGATNPIGTPGTSDSVGTAGTSDPTGTPGTTETAGTPGTTETAGTPGTTETAGTPGTTETAGTPGTTETAGY
ncbi:SdrD B-like domain-containing protein, partial [Microbacterium sp. NPDC076911]|uniref:SdrD B-like domain-containing protein n=1 Tax=Microbacterium sp. NPDC076911 TaxID=3154958 RepID=UPI003438E1B4